MDAAKVQVVVSAGEQFKSEYADYIDDCRFSKGLALIFAGMVKINGGGWICYSQEDAQKSYKVDIELVMCECPDNKLRGQLCKHLIAVMIAGKAREMLEAQLQLGEAAHRRPR